MSKPKKGLCGCTRALFRGEDKVNLAERERTVCRECEANKKERTNKMKKLMFVAAVAASTVAFANCEPPTPGPTPTTEEAYVYSIKFSVKTTKGVATGTKDSQGQGSQCVPGQIIPGTCLVYRTKDTTAFQGWIYDCEPTCGSIATGSIILWDTKRKVELEEAAYIEGGFIHVMGKNDTEAEWLFGIQGTSVYTEASEEVAERAQKWTLRAAGLGKFDTRNYRYASFSGNFVGEATAPYDLKTATSKYACACDPSVVYDCTNLVEPVTDNTDTVAYGTWSASFNASASKKLNNQGFLTVPNWLYNEKVLSRGKFYPNATPEV